MEEREQVRWKATWITPNGNPMEFTFYADKSRMLARVDFQLKVADIRMPVPNSFELEEDPVKTILMKETGAPMEPIYLNRLSEEQISRLSTNGARLIFHPGHQIYGKCWQVKLPEGTRTKIILDSKGRGATQRALLFPSGDGVVWFWNRVEGKEEWVSTISLPVRGVVAEMFTQRRRGKCSLET